MAWHGAHLRAQLWPCEALGSLRPRPGMLEVNVFSFMMVGREMVSVYHLILHRGGPQYTLSITLNKQANGDFWLAAPHMVYLSVGIGMLFEISLGPWNKDILAGLASGSRQLGWKYAEVFMSHNNLFHTHTCNQNHINILHIQNIDDCT